MKLTIDIVGMDGIKRTLWRVANALEDLSYNSSRLVDAIKDLRFMSSRPGRLTIIEKEISMSLITFKVVLPELKDADVVSRELTVQVGDGAPQVVTLAKDAVEADGFTGEQDAAIHLSLVDIDDAGNRSVPSVLDSVLVDTFPPAQPGVMVLQETGEEQTPVVEPAPVDVAPVDTVPVEPAPVADAAPTDQAN